MSALYYIYIFFILYMQHIFNLYIYKGNKRQRIISYFHQTTFSDLVCHILLEYETKSRRRCDTRLILLCRIKV